MKKQYQIIIALVSIVISAILIFNTFLASPEAEITTNEQIIAETHSETEPVRIYITTPNESSSLAEDTTEETKNTTESLIENFEIIWQMPELPTGCEITAMTMVLNYYGFDVDKVDMATNYLPTVAAEWYYGSDDKLYGPDLNSYFVGDTETLDGYVCGTDAILTAANYYLSDQKSSVKAVEITGSSPSDLYQLINEDIPVVVWVTISMEERNDTEGWYTEDGNYVEWSTNDHGAVLIGYSDDTVTIADPISGIIEYDRQDFEDVYESRGKQCIILQ